MHNLPEGGQLYHTGLKVRISRKDFTLKDLITQTKKNEQFVKDINPYLYEDCKTIVQLNITH